MKQILATIGLFILANLKAVSAQTFITSNSSRGDSAIVNGTGTLTIHNDIKATAGSAKLKWNVIGTSSNVATTGSQWSLDGICDNVTCYSNANLLSGTSHTTDFYGSTAFSTFYILLTANNVPNGSTAWVQINVRDTTTAGTVRTLTFIGTKNPSGVAQMTATEGVQVFPNPAGSNIIVSSGKNTNLKRIIVLSLEGKQVASQEVSEIVSTVPLGNLAPGKYLINLIGVNGKLISTNTFMHQ